MFSHRPTNVSVLAMWLAAGIIAAGLLIPAAPAIARPAPPPPPTLMYSFGNPHGEYPWGNLTLSLDGSTLYGMTQEGGAHGQGTIFSLPASGGTPTVLFSFDGVHGATPRGSLTLSPDGSTLYGMTPQGGTINYGTIFSISTSGGTPTILHSFNGAYGAFPDGNLTLSGSTLYGMTITGGNGYGTIFSIPTSGGTPTSLCRFDGTNGANPVGSLTLSPDGATLYGMTEYGGNGFTSWYTGQGVIFSLSTSGGTPNVLFLFDGTHGEDPRGDLTLSGSTLYGMTHGGGDSIYYGTVFSLPTAGGTPTVLLSFDYTTNGCYPYGNLTLSGSTLYGMTLTGGPNGNGTIFSIPTSGGASTILHSFNWNDGYAPYGSLTLSGSTLYGMTNEGGIDGEGAIFSISTSGGELTALFSFDAPYGRVPYGDLTISGSTMYGMTSEGGAHGDGTVFSLPASGGTPKVLFSFDRNTTGASPQGSLVLNSDGSTLYGMANQGGDNDVGTIFSVPTAGGQPTVLFSFDWNHGEYPYGSLTLSGSTLYGMTSYGGDNYRGTIFSISTSGGTPTVLFLFDGTNGARPEGSLTLSPDGSTLYGMAQDGVNHDGVIFSIPTSGGTPTILFAFDGTNDESLHGSLTLSPDGATLYGMANQGGDNDMGTIFSIPTSAGAPNILFSFDNTSGAYPIGSLTLSGSTLYGMTEEGGDSGQGTIFSISTSGGPPTILYTFDGTIGADPWGSLTLSPNGSGLYGMTPNGGVNGGGTIFSFLFVSTLTTSASPAGAGTVSASPSQATYNAGTVVGIAAAARPGYVFSSWVLTDSGNNDLTATNVDHPTSYSASLNMPAFSVTLTAVFTRPSGQVLAWGGDSFGELGNNDLDRNFRETPGQVLGAGGSGVLTDVVSVSAGLGQTVALKADGTVWGCGDNSSGQLGDNANEFYSYIPVQTLGLNGNGVLTDVAAISAGYGHTAAVKNDGTVWTWGWNGFGLLGDNTTTQRNTPVQVVGPAGQDVLTNVVAVSAGNTHTVALKADGTVWTWGENGYKQLGVNTTPESHTPVQVVSPDGQGFLTGIVAVSAGYAHNVALKSDGTVWTWGVNWYAQLGNNSTEDSYLPVQVRGANGYGMLTDVVAVAAGAYHSLAVKSDGTVWAWGNNWDGELGDDGNEDCAYTPVQVLGPDGNGVLTGVTAVAAGEYHSVALKSDGTVWSWGYNYDGELGDNTTEDRYTPVQVVSPSGSGYLTGIVAVSAGYYHTIALAQMMTLTVQGNGSGSGTISVTPSQASYTPGTTVTIQALANPGYTFVGWLVTGGTVADAASATTSLTITGNCTLTAVYAPVTQRQGGLVLAWGDNSYGALGDGTTDWSNYPVQVVGPDDSGVLTDVVSVAAGNNYTVALMSDGTVWTWGDNSSGQLGDNGNEEYSTTPVQVLGAGGNGFLTGVVAIAAGYSHAVAVKSDGTVWAWGDNEEGQLGDNSYDQSNVPVQVVSPEGDDVLTGVTDVAAGEYHTVALKSDGTVWTWGANWYGQLGDNSYDESTVPVQVVSPDGQGVLAGVTAVAAGAYHTVALQSDSTVWTWGYNWDGELGDNSYDQSTAPVQVVSPDGQGVLTGVTAVAAGGYHTVALKADGTVLTWGANWDAQLGDNSYEQSNVPVQVVSPNGQGVLTGVAAVAAGEYQTIALKSDGTVWNWGGNQGPIPSQQLGADGSHYLSGITAVSAGSYFTVALIGPLTLTVQVSPAGDGTVTVTPSQATYTYGDTVTFSQTPAAGYTFTRWTVVGGQSDGWSTLTMHGNVTLTAGYVLSYSFSGTEVVTGSGTISVDTGGPYDYGEWITVTASAQPGYVFAGWSVTGPSEMYDAGAATTWLIVQDSFTLTANFVPVQPGLVWSWGYNGEGELGDNAAMDHNAPGLVVGPGGSGALTDVVAVAGGGYHTVALKSDGTVWTWGYNGVGELGDNRNGEYRSITPVQVVSPDGQGVLTGITAVAAGGYHTVALKSDGTVWTWGYNNGGALGDNGQEWCSYSPVQVVAPSGSGYLTDIVAVSAGANHTMALKSDGTVWAWGDNTYGQLGINNPTITQVYHPVQVVGPNGSGYLTEIVAVAGGGYHTVALKSDGTVWTWGRNDYGQLGDNDAAIMQAAPVQVVDSNGSDFLTDVVAVAACNLHSVALKSDGTVWTWGVNSYGQLGYFTSTLSNYVPGQVVDSSGSGSLAGVSAIAAGSLHTVALKSDGTVWAWGNNNNGELGDNLTDQSTVPVQAVGPGGNGVLTDIAAIAAGGYHSLALLGPRPSYNLTVTTAPSAGGMATCSPSGNTWNYGEVVTLTASASPGYIFGGWTVSGGSVFSSSSAQTTMFVTSNTTVTASFTYTGQMTYTVALTQPTGGTIGVTGGPNYNLNDTPAITASANNGYTFDHWVVTGGTVSGETGNETLTVEGNVTLSAVFTPLSYSGTESQVGGTITLSNSGPYTYGQVITVTASPQAGYAFSGWSVTGSSTLSNSATTSTSLTVYDDFTLTASFTLETFTVTAVTSKAWVYQNTPLTTQDRHVVVLTVSVTQDTWGNSGYTTTVTQSGSGAVTPTGSWTSGSLVTPTLSATWAGLTGYLVGGRVSGPVTSVGNLAVTGSCTVHVVVTGNVGGSASADVTILVRPLGDINGSGLVDRSDLAILNARLNNFAIAPQTDADGDLSGDGYVTAADRVLLNRILNGLAAP